MESLKLMVVEDDAASLDLITEALTALKVEVRSVADSDKASTLINQERFDGIVLDLEMPKVHGFELAHRIRQSSWNKTTPIIVVTGRDEPDTMQKAFATGATFFLQKPIDRKKLNGLFRTVQGSLADNHRRSVRVPIQTDVTCVQGSRTVRGRTWNLSQGGMQVEVGELTPAKGVNLSFCLPTSSTVIEALGTVIWVMPERQGIRFLKITDQNREEIRRFITQVEKP